MPPISIIKLLFVLVFAAFLGVGSTRPAQASIVDCLNALIPVGSALKLVDAAADPEFLQCSAHMSTGDPIFISTVGLVIGAGAAGAFNSEATCQQMTTGQIGKLIAGVLSSMGSLSSALKSLLGEDGYKALVDFATSEGASNIATETPLKSVFEYMSCGCTLYGKAKAVAEVATSYIGDVKQCAGFVGDVGGAILDLAESGADAVGELLGHHADGPVAVQENNYPQCGEWQFMRDSAVVSPGGNVIVETIVPRPYLTQVRTCSCGANSKVEIKAAEADGLIAVRCACDAPVNGIYNSKTNTCGCRPSETLKNGTCVACDTETFSQTESSVSVASGTVTQGVCQPVSQTCPAGQKPVRAQAGYYYECKSVCEPGTFYIKQPGDLPSDGLCTSCPANKVPDATLLKQGRLQCQECPAGTVSTPGDRQCRTFQCANGVDPGNPHACRPACRLDGQGKTKRLVCNSGFAVDTPLFTHCPSGMILKGHTCVPELHHKPPVIQKHQERERPATRVPTRKRTEQRRLEDGRPVARERRREQRGDTLLGPVEPRYSGPSMGELLDLGRAVGGAIDLAPRGREAPATRPGTATEAMPDTVTVPRTRLPAQTVPNAENPVQRYLKD